MRDDRRTRRHFLELVTASISAPFVARSMMAMDQVTSMPPLKKRVEQLLGKPPDRCIVSLSFVNWRKHDDDPKSNFVRDRITLNGPDGDIDRDPIEAWLLTPKHLPKPAPAVLCLHQTDRCDHGLDEPPGVCQSSEGCGSHCDDNVHYARELTERGYITLTPGYWTDATDHSFWAEDKYLSPIRKSIRNFSRAIDFLRTLPSVDKGPIGCIGHSAGGTHALYLALFEPRIGAVVSSGGFGTWKGTLLKHPGNTLADILGTYMPLIKNYDQNTMPFDLADVTHGIAPRPVFLNMPKQDQLVDFDTIYAAAIKVAEHYKQLHAADHFCVQTPEVSHDFPPNVRICAYKFLDKWLRHQAQQQCSSAIA